MGRYPDIDGPMIVAGGLIGLLLLSIPFLIYASIQEQREWNRFAQAHHCQVIGHMEGSTGIGIGPSTGGNGGVAVVTTSEPGKIGYRCDDGQEYWRNE